MPNISCTATPIEDLDVDLAVLGVYEGGALATGAKTLANALDTDLEALFATGPLMSKAFTGGVGQVVLVPTLGKVTPRQILFVGLGPKAKADRSVARQVGAVIARRSGGVKSVATNVIDALRGKDVVATFVEGFLLGSYSFEKYKSEQVGQPNRIEDLALVMAKDSVRASKAAVSRAEAVATGVCLTRDLINTPSGNKSPASLAAEAQRLAKTYGFAVRVWNEKDLAKEGFGGHIGVGKGSAQPPRMVELRYEPRGAKKTIAVVGKGITFDSGGLNLKPGASMTLMKTDMSGAAAVLGLFETLGQVKPKGVAVRGYLACAENMPDGAALRPGDVITHYGGLTSEIGNTDAEGRLVLGDALAYAKEQQADVIVDIATLTGAITTSLGLEITGVFGNDDKQIKTVLAAGERAGEPGWHLPLWEPYRKAIASPIADQNNAGSATAGGGSITAALFLSKFVGDTPWLHLDIAGTSRSGEVRFEIPKGASGTGVRTLLEFIEASA